MLRSIATVACALLSACGEADPPRPERPPIPEGATVLAWEDGATAPVDAVASVAEDSAAPRPERLPVVHRPAAGPDVDHDSDEVVEARRIVYRVRLGVPGILGSPLVDLVLPAAELFIDVSEERLRARFVGPGWPVDAGSEVRLRGDSPGSYVIDGQGGRPLEPGALATWFEGGAPRPGPRPYVRRDPVADDVEAPRPGELVCALVAEWTAESRSAMQPRCGSASPVAFRVGFFRGERTADVPIELPRSALRADEAPPLPEVTHVRSRALLEGDALARLRAEMHRGEEIDSRDVEPPVSEGLIVVNESDGRMVVVVDGVAIGWVDAGTSGHFLGLTPGVHEVGGMRPRGAVIMRQRLVSVPGRTVLRYRAPRN